ncbi:hypothetical protein [Pedobacter deserti]|uniref:hypothetical protein n=1 Tax=Pedobacter deserti TaxID=2817382 RepID=UPI00210B4794|nr:hypothetical protein [Pedobacter sp. SYSU D00382]
MAQFKGKHLSGLMGNLVARRGRDGSTILQIKASRVKQTKATKASAGVFGKASSLACDIRTQLGYLYGLDNDSGMVNRFNTPVRDVLMHCFDKETQTYSFQEDSFSRLAGFNFNIKSPLENTLWVMPEVTLEGTSLKVSIPELEIGSNLLFPDTTKLCVLRVAVSRIALYEGLTSALQTQELIINREQGIVPAQEFTFEVPQGCLCTAAIGLLFYEVSADNVRYSYNCKEFSPAAILGAIIVPGEFVPPPVIKESNRLVSNPWTSSSVKFTAPSSPDQPS